MRGGWLSGRVDGGAKGLETYSHAVLNSICLKGRAFLPMGLSRTLAMAANSNPAFDPFES